LGAAVEQGKEKSRVVVDVRYIPADYSRDSDVFGKMYWFPHERTFVELGKSKYSE
jgi:hypothetical protein